jgi:hypothetical protein
VSKVWFIAFSNRRYQLLVTDGKTTKDQAKSLVKEMYEFSNFEIEEAQEGAFLVQSARRIMERAPFLDEWFSPQQPRGAWDKGKLPYTGRTLVPGEEIE